MTPDLEEESAGFTQVDYRRPLVTRDLRAGFSLPVACLTRSRSSSADLNVTPFFLSASAAL